MPVVTPRISDSSRGSRRASSASGNAMTKPRSTETTVIPRCWTVASTISCLRSVTYCPQIHSLVKRL